MFSDLNPLNRSTAILEIVIMLFGAAIIGFVIAWLLRKPKAEAKKEAKTSGNQKGQLGKLERTIANLQSEKASLEKEFNATKKLVALQKKEVEKLRKGNGAESGNSSQNLKALEAKVLEIKAQSKEKSEQIVKLKEELKQLTEKYEKEKAEFEKEKAAAFTRELELKKREDALAKVSSGSSEKDKAKLSDLEGKIRALQSQNFNLVTEVQKLKKSPPIEKEAGDEMEWLRKEKDGLEKEVEDLEGSIDRLQKENSDLRTQARDKSSAGPIIEKLEKEKAKLKAEIAKLKKTPATKTPLPSINFAHLGKATSAEKDKLTLISGIGPVVEGKLNGLGIFTFSQIAKLKTSDMEAIDKLLQLFPGRVKRERWLQQATKLMNAEA